MSRLLILLVALIALVVSPSLSQAVTNSCVYAPYMPPTDFAVLYGN